MDISAFQKEVHEAAKLKGWWDSPRSALECHMLMVSELAEATEEARNGTPPIYLNDSLESDSTKLCKTPGDANFDVRAKSQKTEGELVELADCVIRILDYCASRGWDLEQAMRIKHEYNKTRPHRHGGKRF